MQLGSHYKYTQSPGIPCRAMPCAEFGVHVHSVGTRYAQRSLASSVRSTLFAVLAQMHIDQLHAYSHAVASAIIALFSPGPCPIAEH
jgi:hypothetical protein